MGLSSQKEFLKLFLIFIYLANVVESVNYAGFYYPNDPSASSYSDQSGAGGPSAWCQPYLAVANQNIASISLVGLYSTGSLTLYVAIYSQSGPLIAQGLGSKTIVATTANTVITTWAIDPNTPSSPQPPTLSTDTNYYFCVSYSSSFNLYLFYGSARTQYYPNGSPSITSWPSTFSSLGFGSHSNTIQFSFYVSDVAPVSSATGDPLMIGFHGERFYFHGLDHHVYNIFSSSFIQINGELSFISSGRNLLTLRNQLLSKSEKKLNIPRTQGWTHPGTYFTSMGISFIDNDSKNRFLIGISSDKFELGPQVIIYEIQDKNISIIRPLSHISNEYNVNGPFKKNNLFINYLSPGTIQIKFIIPSNKKKNNLKDDKKYMLNVIINNADDFLNLDSVNINENFFNDQKKMKVNGLLGHTLYNTNLNMSKYHLPLPELDYEIESVNNNNEDNNNILSLLDETSSNLIFGSACSTCYFKMK